MNALPVIHRELRAASRRRSTWQLRASFGLVATLAFAFGMLVPHVDPKERGQLLLVCLTVSGFVLSLFAGAYLTADAITSEKRERTLGLLFLTPLNGWQIVLGKLATHSLQVGYALVSGAPLLFLPILLGGVVWAEVIRILLVMLLTFMLSLAVGMFWSTVTREARTSILATTVSLILISVLPWLLCLLEVRLSSGRAPVLTAPALLMSPVTAIVFGFEHNFRVRVGVATGLISGPALYWGSVACLMAGSWLLTFASAWLLPREWRKTEAGEAAGQPARANQVRSARRISLPRWAPRPGASPLLWLAARDLCEPSWLRLLRLVTLVFFGIMLLVSVSTNQWEVGFIAACCSACGLHLVTRIQFALSATRRLQEDRRSGALELVLTTPIEDLALVRAHDNALKRAFRWPLFVLLSMNVTLQLALILFFEHLHMRSGTWALFSVFFVGGIAMTLTDFFALRWLTLREALRCATHLKAAGRALGKLVLGAWLAFAVAFLVAVQFRRAEQAAVVFLCWVLFCVAYDVGLVIACRRWLRRGIRQRAAEV